MTTLRTDEAIAQTKRYMPWLVAVSLFMENLDATIVNTAVPTMAANLEVTPLSLKGVLTSYTLCLAVFIPISGWMADRFGTKRVFTWAVCLFTLGSLACGLAPSARGELEITDVNKAYLARGDLQVEVMGRGFAWLDTGTHESLMEAGNYIQTIENRQGLKVCCPEEIAYLNGWIDAEQLLALAAPLAKTGYGQYLQQLTRQGHVR